MTKAKKPKLNTTSGKETNSITGRRKAFNTPNMSDATNNPVNES